MEIGWIKQVIHLGLALLVVGFGSGIDKLGGILYLEIWLKSSLEYIQIDQLYIN